MQQIIKNEIDLWCKKHPFGHIFSHDNIYHCSHHAEDSNELQRRSLRLAGLELRTGFLRGKEGYEYDCPILHVENGQKFRNSYSYYLLNLLQEILHFEVRPVYANTWGTFSEINKNWTGLVGLAKINVIDLGICHMTVTEDRSNQVDFLFSTLSSTRSFVFQPLRLPLSRDVFISTFSPMLWLCFFVAIFLLIVCFRFSTWLHSRLRPDHEPWSWVEVILWANAAICQQSYNRHPKGSSCRTTFLIGYLITYLLYTGFAAGVTSLLAVQGHDIHLQFKDIVKLNLNLILPSDGTQFDFLKNSPDEYARTLHSNFLEVLQHQKARTVKELFLKLRNENFVALGSTVMLINYIRKNIPAFSHSEYSLSQIPNSLHQKAFIVPKKSHYREIFNYWILRLRESGLLDYGGKKYIKTEVKECCQEIGWSSAGLENVFSAIVILVGGWFLSVFILCMEIAWRRRTANEVRG